MHNLGYRIKSRVYIYIYSIYNSRAGRYLTMFIYLYTATLSLRKRICVPTRRRAGVAIRSSFRIDTVDQEVAIPRA